MAISCHQDILACPNCKEKLSQTQKCDRCGLEFSEIDGTPRLVGENINRLVQFQFNSKRSTITNEFISKILKDPSRAVSSTQVPYHMDMAHINVIENINHRGQVLEIGCGGGQNRHYFTELGFDYVGIDISKTRVFEWLQEFGGPDYLCDAHFLPFLNQKFDIVYCAAVFEHLACPFLAAQEVHRVLKPGGYFLGNISFLEPWHDNSFNHMTPLGVIELLHQADFEIECIWPGQGYSGYKAMLLMGSRLTKAFLWLGKAMYMLYRTEHELKSWLKGMKEGSPVDILNRAKVAGAIDWIARRPDN